MLPVEKQLLIFLMIFVTLSRRSYPQDFVNFFICNYFQFLGVFHKFLDNFDM